MQLRSRLRQLVGENAGKGTPIQARASNSGGLEILIYDVIDPWWGVSAKGFADAMKDAGNQPLTVRVNSPGGDVFDGRAIASMIRAHKGPTKVIVDGLAASAASTIAVAAQETVMAKGAFLMVHQSWAFAMDNADGLRTLADLLEKIDGQIGADYAAKAGVTAEKAAEWMKAETWFTADEAVEAGLAASVLTDEADLKAFNLDAFDRAPEPLLARMKALTQLGDVAQAANDMRAAAERRLRLFAS
jgi:ATP-dependent Clp protease protease subunit